MPRRTRRSVAKASSPDSSDLDNDKSSPGTPMFSKSTTATAKTTPALSTASTADADSDEKAQSLPRKTTAKKRSRKDTEDDDINMDDGSPAAGVAKRRAVSKQFYVEIPVLNNRKGKGKSPPPIGKGKAKAVPTKTSTRPSRRVTTSTVASTRTSNDDEEEILEPSQSELEFDENQDLEDSEESDDDGSVFEGSDEENEAEEDEDSEEEFEEVVSPMKRKTTARQTRGRAKSEELDEDEVMELEMEQAMIGDAAFDDDEEAAMLSLAVSESLALSTPRTANEAGPSSSKSRSKAAKLRANAAERRAGKEILSDEESAVMSDASDESNGGGFVNEGKKKSYKPTVGGKKGTMTLSMLKAERREERKLKKAELSDRKKMERAEAKRLGRKLTVAEKTTLALHHHHPELKDVWGNLERTVKPIQPERAEQPDGLKVTLLGFQQESLFWMRKQEKGIWRGGCLADEMVSEAFW
ncbi:DNA repair protein rad16 [Tulasnella sp. 419]|nr:DNA repair protein rad16 [Tulasnella sp. 419]